MMALPAAPPAPTASSQPTDTPTASFPHLAPKSSTPNIDATSAFRPSIPQKNSRIPAVEIDKLSFSKTNNQNNDKYTSIGISILSTGGAQSSLPPPALPHPPIKGISNAQARTARKSAPSSSNRGDGYSTSSSGGGGKKSISGAGKNKEKRERDPLIVNEVPGTPISGTDGSSLTRSPQPQSPLSSSPKQHLQAQLQAQKLQQQQQQVQLSLENGEKPQQKEAMSPVVPAPPSFAGPSTQVAGVKRPAPPAIPLSFSSMVSSKPKRQKIATPKAAALAIEAGMNADGSAAKKRKPRRNASEKSGKEKEKPGKEKGKEPKKVEVFLKIMGGHYDLPETTHRHPILPPAYQKPNTQQEQGRKDTLIRIAATVPATGGIKPGFLGPQTLTAPSTVSQTSSVISSTKIQALITQPQPPDDVILISSSPSAPIPYHTLDCQSNSGNRQVQDEQGDKPVPKTDQQGRHQSTPITIDGGCSEPDDGSGDAKSLGKDCRKEDFALVGVKSDETKTQDTAGYDNGSLELMQVSDEFFAKCLSASDGECAKILMEVEASIKVLSAEAKKQLPNVVEHYLQRQQDSSALAKIAARLKHMGVLTNEGEVITLDKWKCSGTPKFKGRLVLSDCPEIWCGVPGGESSNNPTLSGGLQPLGSSSNKLKGDDVDVADADGKHTTPPVEVSTKPQGTTAIDGNISPHGSEQAMAEESSATGKQKESWDPANGSPLSVGIINSLSIPHASPLPSEPALSSKDSVPQPQPRPGQKPSSPSNQIQAEADASVTSLMLTLDVSEAPTPSPVSGKGKRKAFATPTVQDFLKESRIIQETQSPRRSGFIEKQQGRNDPLLAEIAILHRRELSVRDEIDTLAAKSKQKELEFERRIAEARVGAKVSADDEMLDSELGLMVVSQVDWEGFRKVTKELMDFQDYTRREELRLADKAARIAEEMQYFIERRKRLRQMESESDTTPSCTTSEERSLDNNDSTAQSSAPSSVSGFSAARQITPSIDVGTRAAHSELSVGHELLQALIPWAKQLHERTAENTSPMFVETGAHQMKPKKKPIRRKKHW